MPEERDRYGDKLRDAEKGREDKFFADRDRQLVERMQQASAGTVDAATRGRCPRDGQTLTKVSHLDVVLDECPACKGMWLDKGDLDKVAQRESSGWLARFLGRSR
jgi:hypothetical protein